MSTNSIEHLPFNKIQPTLAIASALCKLYITLSEKFCQANHSCQHVTGQLIHSLKTKNQLKPQLDPEIEGPILNTILWLAPNVQCNLQLVHVYQYCHNSCSTCQSVQQWNWGRWHHPSIEIAEILRVLHKKHLICLTCQFNDITSQTGTKLLTPVPKSLWDKSFYWCNVYTTSKSLALLCFLKHS